MGATCPPRILTKHAILVPQVATSRARMFNCSKSGGDGLLREICHTGARPSCKQALAPSECISIPHVWCRWYLTQVIDPLA